MPPPAARPRTSSYSGAAGGGSASKQKQRKPPTVRTGGAGGGGASGGGSSAVRLGAPPYSAAGLEARLAVADIPELANMLSAISRKERRLVGGGVFWSCYNEACVLAVSLRFVVWLLCWAVRLEDDSCRPRGVRAVRRGWLWLTSLSWPTC